MGIGALFVYFYSIKIGFGQGFFKGLFMMFVPIIAQLWLCVERGLTEAVGFSNLYSWSTITVFVLGLCVSKAQKTGAVDKIGLGMWFLLLGAMIAWHDQGATKPEKVAIAFAQATLRKDEALATYYATEELGEYIKDIDTDSLDYKLYEEMAVNEWKRMRNKKMVAKIVRNDGARLKIETWYNVEKDVWEPNSEEILVDTPRGWKVDSGMSADIWKGCPRKHKK